MQKNLKLDFTHLKSALHKNVAVISIDNAVLWNCRDKSVTKQYYAALYWMLIAATFFILLIFTAVKVYIVIAGKCKLIYLWRLAVLEHLYEKFCAGKYHEKDAICYHKLLTQPVCNIKIPKAEMQARIVILVISMLMLPIAIFLSALSYDLHPLSCITGTSEDTISYNETSMTVELRHSDGVLIFRTISVSVALCLGIILLINIFAFALLNYFIIKILKSQVDESKIKVIKMEIDKLVKDKQNLEPDEVAKLQSQIVKLKELLSIEQSSSIQTCDDQQEAAHLETEEGNWVYQQNN